MWSWGGGEKCAAVWHVGADSDRQRRKARRSALIKTERFDKRKAASCLPQKFNPPFPLVAEIQVFRPIRIKSGIESVEFLEDLGSNQHTTTARVAPSRLIILATLLLPVAPMHGIASPETYPTTTCPVDTRVIIQV